MVFFTTSLTTVLGIDLGIFLCYSVFPIALLSTLSLIDFSLVLLFGVVLILVNFVDFFILFFISFFSLLRCVLFLTFLTTTSGIVNSFSCILSGFVIVLVFSLSLIDLLLSSLPTILLFLLNFVVDLGIFFYTFLTTAGPFLDITRSLSIGLFLIFFAIQVYALFLNTNNNYILHTKS